MKPVKYPLIVVTPVYEDVEACSCLFAALAGQFGNDVFVVAVDDGSLRQPLTVDVLENARIAGLVIKLRRNVGHQCAIAIGLGYCYEHFALLGHVVVMDSDGEDLPDTIPVLLDKLRRSGAEAVVAQRKSRVETLRFKAFYTFYKLFFGLITGRSISFGNFMALTPVAIKRLVAMPELAIHVAAAVLASKLRIESCPLDRGPRYAGRSKMNFVALVLHGFKGLMVFAEDVLVRVGIACTLIASLSVIGAVIAVMLKLIGFSTPGWFSVAVGILMLLFLQTGAITLMTLMLTGVVRGGGQADSLTFQKLIDEVVETSSRVQDRGRA